MKGEPTVLSCLWNHIYNIVHGKYKIFLHFPLSTPIHSAPPFPFPLRSTPINPPPLHFTPLYLHPLTLHYTLIPHRTKLYSTLLPPPLNSIPLHSTLHSILPKVLINPKWIVDLIRFNNERPSLDKKNGQELFMRKRSFVEFKSSLLTSLGENSAHFTFLYNSPIFPWFSILLISSCR